MADVDALSELIDHLALQTPPVDREADPLATPLAKEEEAKVSRSYM